MFIPNSIDYDRLQHVVECINGGIPTDCGAGRTFAFMHLMAGELALGDFNNVYLYIAPTHDIARHAMREFVEYAKSTYDPYVFESINQSSLTLVTTHHQRYMFMGNQSTWIPSRRLQGVRVVRAFVDVPFHQHNFWLQEVITRVNIVGGDVLF